MKKLIVLRRASQAVSLTFFIYVLWSTTYPLEGFFPAGTFFKIDPLIIFITSLSQRVLLPGVISAGIMILLTFVLGRFFCGWICPLGSMLDLFACLRKKKIYLSDGQNRKYSLIKYLILLAIILLAIFGIQAAWIFDPLVISARFISLNFIPTATLIIDRVMVGLIQASDYYTPLYDLYRWLKQSVLGINAYFFANSLFIFLFFIFILISALFISRAWCRFVCPLGAFYGSISRFSMLRRVLGECTKCMACRKQCRMQAIKDDLTYSKSECILCMDCVYDCPPKITNFNFKDTVQKEDKGINRRQFLILMFFSLVVSGFKGRKRESKILNGSNIIRPPGVANEQEFLDRCIRCGNCMKVCITNGLQPAMFESGPQGIWTPRLVPEIGYCEYNCNLCGNVCPTGAIPKLGLENKKEARLGTAVVNKPICLAWGYGQECLVCEEHCPVPDKAIKIEKIIRDKKAVLVPIVDKNKCIGCGICQNKCPARPDRAIKVYPDLIGEAI